MKKTLLSFLTVVGLASTALAQTSPVTFGIKAGVTLPNMTLSAGSASVSFDSKTSFYVGGTADIALSNIFSLQPGLSLVNKGTKINGADFSFDQEDVTDAGTGTLNFMYIEVPVNLLANFDLGTGKIFFGGGPYYGVAIDAYAKAEGVKEDIEIGGDEDNLKRGEFGVNFLGGYQLNNGLNIHAGYGLGLTSVLPEQDASIKLKNRVFSFGLGFRF